MKLITTREGKDHVVDSLAKGLNLLKMWQIVSDGLPQQTNSKSPDRISDKWNLITSKIAHKHT